MRKIDITGQIFTGLTVLKECPERVNGRIQWICSCICGKVVRIDGGALRGEGSKTCGCLTGLNIKKLSRRTKIKPGDIYGNLLVIKECSKNSNKNITYLCKCICGNEKITCSYKLSHNIALHCGCKHGELINSYITKHGYSKSTDRHPAYSIWLGIKQRCLSPLCCAYRDYGGRGITICEEWKNNPKVFVEWALENGYEKGLTIERIDVNGNYEPNNCKWITRYEQVSNRRNTIYISYRGKNIAPSKEWQKYAVSANVNYRTFLGRIIRDWDIEEAALKPPNIKTRGVFIK